MSGRTPVTSMRLDPTLKSNAQKVFNNLHVNMTTAVNMYLAEVVRTQSIPLELDASKKTEKQAKPYRVASLFSGCGGMDLGFKGGFEVFGTKYPETPFDIIWANELNPSACKTYAANFSHGITCGDIWEHINEVPKGIDVLIGGFPCQDISINGKMAGANGARSGLYRAMIAAIKKAKPKVFVAENVKGLLLKRNADSLEQILSDFDALGYDVTYGLYHVADYGVPQIRERVIIVGTAKGVKSFRPPLPILDKDEWMTVKEAIDDLKDKDWDREIGHIWSKAKKSGEQGGRMMVADKPGYTIRAECHGNIQFHYNLPRRISMREAARIQSFPDTFKLPCGLRETERQIGNAVPPVFAWYLAQAVAECLEES